MASACRRASHEPLLTYFNGEHALSLQYPASWRGDQGQQDGLWYRYFTAPAGAQKQSELSVTLVAGTRGLEELAQGYVADGKITASGDENRQGARGKWYAFDGADGTRHTLVIVQDGPGLVGFHAFGTRAQFESRRGLLDDVQRSFTLERPSQYPVDADPRFGYALAIPASWRSARSMSGNGSLFKQWTSPPLALESNATTIHLSLELSVEPLPASVDLDAFYARTRAKLGDAYKVVLHAPWRDGYADLIQTETPVSASRIKRFSRVANGRGYSLVFEARDDVFPRVSRWCDMIAGTLKVGAEVTQK